MTDADFDWDAYEKYAEYDEENAPARERRRPAQKRLVEQLADATDSEMQAFETTYKPSRHEATWLLSSLHTFYTQHFLCDVLAQVKGGKEASVYRCMAHPRMEREFVAAKVYRPRQFRSLRNDAMYREGRPVLTGDGRPVKATDTRLMRALGKKTDFGVQVAHTSWIMYEYTTMETLHRAGAAVPEPIAAGENALLMSYHGDAHAAAPTLIEVRLPPEEAAPLCEEVMRNIELMLQHGWIHGDLSAYNILYREGAITLIDFPQVTSCTANANARFILQRDITRVCEYFASYGVARDPAEITKRLWKQYAEVPQPGL